MLVNIMKFPFDKVTFDPSAVMSFDSGLDCDTVRLHRHEVIALALLLSQVAHTTVFILAEAALSSLSRRTLS